MNFHLVACTLLEAFPSLFPSFCAREPRVWLRPPESKREIWVIFWASFKVNDRWSPWHWAAFLVPPLPEQVEVVLPLSHAHFLCDSSWLLSKKSPKSETSKCFPDSCDDPCHVPMVGPVHLNATVTPAVPASMLTAQPEHLYWACQQNRHQNSFKNQKKSSPLCLLQTSCSTADLWGFASLLSVTQWWLPAANPWIWTSKRQQEGGWVRCAFHRRLFRVGCPKGVWLFSSLPFCCGGTDLCYIRHWNRHREEPRQSQSERRAWSRKTEI